MSTAHTPHLDGIGHAIDGVKSTGKVLPDDVLHQILIHSQQRDIPRFAQVSSQWYWVANEDRLWRHMALERFAFAGPDKLPDEGWRRYYVRTIKTRNGWTKGTPRSFKMMPMRGHTDFITGSAMVGNNFFSASHDCTVRTWSFIPGPSDDPAKGTVHEGGCVPHTNPLSSMEVADSNAYCGDTKSNWVQMDMEAGVVKGVAQATHDEVAPLLLSVDSENDMLVTAVNRHVQVWDLRSHREAHSWETYHPVRYLKCAFDKKQQVVATTSASAEVIDVRGKDKCLHNITFDSVSSSLWCPELDELVVGEGGSGFAASNKVSCYDSKTGALRRSKDVDAEVTAVARHGSYLAVGCNTGRMHLINCTGSGDSKTLEGHTGRINDIKMDGMKILSGAADGCILVHNPDARDGKQLFALLGGSLRPNPRNPPHPTKPWLSALHFDDSQVLAVWNSMMRLYNFALPAATAAAALVPMETD